VGLGLDLHPPFFPMIFRFLFAGLVALVLSSCVSDEHHLVEVSVPDQRMAVYRDGVRIREYPISTSKF